MPGFMSQGRLASGPWWSWPLSATLWSVNRWPTSALRRNTLLLVWPSHGSWPWRVLPHLFLDGPGTPLYITRISNIYACQVLKIKLNCGRWYILLCVPAARKGMQSVESAIVFDSEEIMAVHVSAGTSQRECSVPVGLTTTPQSLRSTTPHSSSTCLSSTSASPSSSFFSATVAYSAQCARWEHHSHMLY